MPRKNTKARETNKKRRTYVSIGRVVRLPVKFEKDDGMSVGRLVAVGEWRE